MANLDGRAVPLFEGLRSAFPGSAMAWRRVSQLPLRATAESGRRPSGVTRPEGTIHQLTERGMPFWTFLHSLYARARG
jgi:hypothetical protein